MSLESIHEDFVRHMAKKMDLDEVIKVYGIHLAKKVAMCGTYGKDGTEPLRLVFLYERETDHLQAILRTQPQLNEAYTKVIHQILKDRGEIPESFNFFETMKWVNSLSREAISNITGMRTCSV